MVLAVAVVVEGGKEREGRVKRANAENVGLERDKSEMEGNERRGREGWEER